MKKLLILLLFTVFNIAHAKDQTILFLGDSLTEGYGLKKEQAFPKLVQDIIEQKLQKKVQVINGGVSGSTTSDALSRLKWYLRSKPDFIFIALGANDGLRGLNLQKSEKNLEAIINTAQQTKAKVLLAGMLLPPNYGQEYTQNFEKMYKNLQTKYNIKTMPFLLKDVAGEKSLNQADGIHPNAQGHIIIANNVFAFLKEEL